MMTAAGVLHLGKRGHKSKKVCRRHLEAGKGKEMKSPVGSPEEAQPS